jgi:beta-lactam-binding protein with PASTA domain
VPMPDVSGLEPAQAIAKLRAAGMTVVRATKASETVPTGKFIGFSPSSGEVPQYGTVKAVYSSGKPAKSSGGSRDRTPRKASVRSGADQTAGKSPPKKPGSGG